MQINLTITVKKVEAKDYQDAREKVFAHLIKQCVHGDRCLLGVLAGVGATSYVGFMAKSRSAKEVDGTYTVTIP